MLNEFSRTQLLFGEQAMNKLKKSRVAVFGVGGVGGYVVEALARTGIGMIDVIDNDKVSLTNINRQIIATHKTIGQDKVDVIEERIHDICPDIIVNKFKCFYLPETTDQFDFTQFDYVVDAIDTVKGKLEIVKQANLARVKIISSMGAGNKVDPTAFKVTDIYKTSVCPLARVMRCELRKMGIKKLKVICSEEQALQPLNDESIIEAESTNTMKRAIPGSTAFVPSVAGLIIASEVIKDLININLKN